MRRTATRRELLKGGIAAGAAASALARPGLAAAASGGEAGVLTHTLMVERVVVITYRSALGTDVLEAPVRARLRGMLAQELQHVSALAAALRARAAPTPVVGVADAQRMLTKHQIHLKLGALRTQRECIKLLIDVESLAEGAYFSAISKLSDPSLIRTCTEVMGCEAQHWTALSAIQHHDDVTQSVPYPFVQGSS